MADFANISCERCGTSLPVSLGKSVNRDHALCKECNLYKGAKPTLVVDVTKKNVL